MALAAVGREEELLAQLRALLFLPSPAPAAPVFKVESPGGRPLDDIMGSSGGRRPAEASSAVAAAEADASSCGGGRRRRRQGSKRDRDDSKAKDEQHDEDLKAALPHHSPPCKIRKKKQQQSISRSIVTSAPEFDGYQWRKYGQKQIQGALYPRSYYRCTRSAEQGCQAKRTVQRNDHDGADGAAAPEYTVVYVAEHTCTANDWLEAPVILETTTVVVSSPDATSTTTNTTGPRDDFHHHTYTDGIVPTTSAGSWSTTITTGTESPAISGDDVTCWSSGGTSISDYSYVADDYYSGGSLFTAAVHGGGWATGSANSAASLLQEEMEDMTGPIRSPVHVPSPGWTIDQLLLQLVNEPVCYF